MAAFYFRLVGHLVVLAAWFAAFNAQAQDLANRPSIGATLAQPKEGCPVFIHTVWTKSPAEMAGVYSGDRLLAVDGTPVTNAEHAIGLIRSAKGSATSLKLWRAGKTFEVSVGTESTGDILRRSGRRILPEGFIVPLDSTDAEIEAVRDFELDRIAARAFPHHIPLDEQLYAAGFEVFLLQNPEKVMVGGIDEGPATDAGVHWGDLIFAIDGVELVGKTAKELEALLSGDQPKRVRMIVERFGETRTFEFVLARVSEILRRNQRKLFQGRVVPLGLADEDLHCFVQTQRGKR